MINVRPSGISNHELRQLSKPLKNFQDFVMLDELDRVDPEKSSCVLNLDKSTGGGTHWTCFSSYDEVVYFDPFGLDPPEGVKDLLKQVSDRPLYNSTRIQPLNSVLCGLYCMYFLLEVNNGKKPLDVIMRFRPFADNLNDKFDREALNDRLVLKYFEDKGVDFRFISQN